MAIVPLIRMVWPSPAIVMALAAAALLRPVVATANPICTDWHAELVTAEGVVEIRRAASQSWSAATPQAALCTGDSLRVLAYSRATLKLHDDTVLRLDANTSLTVERGDDRAGSLLDLIRGMIHVISRDPRALKFSTPYANAGLEGTEFLIAADATQTSVTVLEGEVVLANDTGRVAVRSGEQGVATAASAPRALPFADALELIRWTSYYAPILVGPLPAPDEAPPLLADAHFFNARAARRLEHGRIAEARDDLDRAGALLPGNATTLALRAVLAAKRQDLADARALAASAVRADGRSAAAHLAAAHVHQTQGEIDAAVLAARSATEVDPVNAIAWARLAELWLATNRYADSAAAARRALTLDSSLGYGHTVLGFAELAALRSRAALASFALAVELDRAAPLPRLGYGLALIQDGELERGRLELETAVILDPTDALIRSYMAKAYQVEKRDRLSESQLQLAKEMNPSDPTPWLYDALRKASGNRPAAALRDLHRAVELNDGRAVYRSRLLLDEDLATRNAGFGRLHRELGFEALALARGWQSVASSPTDHSGHRLLADVYSALPRHEIARVSELYQAQLLQPINTAPLSPQLAEVGQFIAQRVAPGELTQSELFPLVNRNGLRAEGSAVAAAHGTRGQTVAVSGLHDRVAYSFGHFDFETDGFRANNDLDQRVTNALLQFRPSQATTLQVELRASDTRKGDLPWFFNADTFNRELRQLEQVERIRLGARRDGLLGGTLLASFSYRDLDLQTSSGPFGLASTATDRDLDVQHLRAHGRTTTRAGVAVSDLRGTERLTSALPAFPGASPPALAGGSPISATKLSAYAYTSVDFGMLALTFGASVDDVETALGERNRLNPKIGLRFAFSDRTTLRAAAFRTLDGHAISRQNAQPRLEPVDVAGFNQFFFGSMNQAATRLGLGVDHELSERLFGGLEVSRRRSEFPVLLLAPPLFEAVPMTIATDEELHRAYLYWTPGDRLALSAKYQYERSDNRDHIFNGYTRMRAQRLPLEARYFHPSGFSASLRATAVEQAGLFSSFLDVQPEGIASPTYGSDRFRIFDASLGYRLPNRRGTLSLNVANLLDQRFRFQDTDPQNPEFLPERMIYLRFTVAVD